MGRLRLHRGRGADGVARGRARARHRGRGVAPRLGARPDRRAPVPGVAPPGAPHPRHRGGGCDVRGGRDRARVVAGGDGGAGGNRRLPAGADVGRREVAGLPRLRRRGGSRALRHARRARRLHALRGRDQALRGRGVRPPRPRGRDPRGARRRRARRLRRRRARAEGRPVHVRGLHAGAARGAEGTERRRGAAGPEGRQGRRWTEGRGGARRCGRQGRPTGGARRGRARRRLLHSLLERHRAHRDERLRHVVGGPRGTEGRGGPSGPQGREGRHRPRRSPGPEGRRNRHRRPHSRAARGAQGPEGRHRRDRPAGSQGRHRRDRPAGAGAAGGDVDLSAYATKQWVSEQFPDLMGVAF